MIHKIKVFILLVLILSVAAINVFFMNGASFSARENRELAQLPDFTFKTVTDGSAFSDFGDFVSDRFWMRDEMMDISSNVKAGIKRNFIKKAFENKEEPTAIVKMDGTGNPVIRQGDNVYFVFQSNDPEINKYTKSLNYAYYNFENINTYVMLVPTAISFIDNYAEKFGVSDQEKLIERTEKTLNNGIKVVKTFDCMQKYKDEYVYFKSDHHWTPLGAYYCYLRFAELADFPPVAARLETAGEFCGSFYDFTNDAYVGAIRDTMYLQEIGVPYWCHGAKSNAEDAVLMHDMYPDDFEGYKKILGGDTGYIRIETLNKNKRRLLVIKDSYANALIPYLTEYFNRVIVIDPRYFEDDLYETVKNEGVTDVLFVNNLETISDDAFVDKLEELSGKRSELN